MENLEIEEIEVWKSIRDYPDYKISNLGNVLSYKRNITQKLNPVKDKEGYLEVTLYIKGNKGKRKKVHRLVAEYFLLNFNGYPQVNHINGIKSDNRSVNLEWCDASMNQLHSYKNLGKISYSKGKKGGESVAAKKIIQSTYPEDKFIKLWGSLTEAAKELKISAGNISGVAQGKKRRAGGFKFKYLN